MSNVNFDIEFLGRDLILLKTFGYESAFDLHLKRWNHTIGRIDSSNNLTNLDNHPIAKGIALWAENSLGMDLYEFLKQGEFIEKHHTITITRALSSYEVEMLRRQSTFGLYG